MHRGLRHGLAFPQMRAYNVIDGTTYEASGEDDYQILATAETGVRWRPPKPRNAQVPHAASEAPCRHWRGGPRPPAATSYADPPSPTGRLRYFRANIVARGPLLYVS